MAELNQALDFRDDGGTPHWRVRHARVIDIGRPSPRQWFRRQKALRLRLMAGGVAFLAPWAVLIGGLLLSYAWFRITGL